MRSDKTHYNDLLDWYGELLTGHQREILEEYYGEDLSMNEIAENYGISKAAVSDLIRRSSAQLEHFESVMRNIERHDALEAVIHDMNNENDKLVSQYAARIDKINRG
ncbi:MAG: DNA-binding protein [Erysipelotrichaceae bacterium]|nr:DNA-binding protein [Erysipelotrichaceae bacterium]